MDKIPWIVLLVLLFVTILGACAGVAVIVWLGIERDHRIRRVRTGEMVAARTWRGIPVPFFFQTTTAEAFRSMQMREDDVILSSIPKTGTTWVHKILYQMLHGIDSDGKPNPAPSTSIGSTNQVYPEALTLTRDAPVDPELSPEANEMRKKFFGGWGFEDDMLGQPAPRLISTHLYGDFLPSELIAPNGKGRLILVLRNMKDTLASLHFFRGEPKDGWLGNEHGLELRLLPLYML